MKTNVKKSEREFYLSVEKVSCQSLIDSGKITYDFLGACSHAVIVTQEDETQLVVGFCSESYGLLPNKDLFPAFEDELAKAYNFDKTYSHQSFAKYYVDYNLNSPSFTVNGEILTPSIKIYHSYNGQLGFKCLFSLQREANQSTLYGMSTILESVHTVALMDGIVGDSIDALTKFVNEDIPKIREVFTQMNATHVKSWKKKLEEISTGTNVIKSLNEEMIDWINANSKGAVTYWTLYCAFNHQLNNNEELGAHDEYKIAQDRKVFNYILKEYMMPK